jgi:drug/metabolite transporter (DMT)-like permease
MNQSIIPVTLLLSYLFLGQKFSWAQGSGAAMIFLGAAVAVIPSFGKKGGATQQTTVTGSLLFFSSIIPGAFSNVYKEYAFKTSVHTDIYYLTTCVSTIQVLFGFAFLPLLSFRAFGGVPFSEMASQLVYGWRCFLGQNSLPGDDCRDGTSTMLG